MNVLLRIHIHTPWPKLIRSIHNILLLLFSILCLVSISIISCHSSLTMLLLFLIITHLTLTLFFFSKWAILILLLSKRWICSLFANLKFWLWHRLSCSLKWQIHWGFISLFLLFYWIRTGMLKLLRYTVLWVFTSFRIISVV